MTNGTTSIHISEEQDEAERLFVSGMFRLLNTLQEGGFDASQVITTFLANLCVDQQAPHRTLKTIIEGTRAKMIFIRETEQ